MNNFVMQSVIKNIDRIIDNRIITKILDTCKIIKGTCDVPKISRIIDPLPLATHRNQVILLPLGDRVA